MKRIPVNSTNLVSVGYDSDIETLEIKFQGGSVYQYFRVPSGIHRALMGATSHGKYFHQHIRDRYRTSQIQ